MSEVRGNIETVTPADILAFERQHPHATPTKHARIRHELGISEIRYYALLLRAAESVDGMSAEPVIARMVRERSWERARMRNLRIAS